MRGSMAAAGARPSLRGTVLPAAGRRRLFESPIAPRQPRLLAIVVPTAHDARDWSLMLARHQAEPDLQFP
jgi:hypothetical protein